MHNDPKISFVIPVYNPPADKFRACIRSLLIQTNKDFEVVLIDDGSGVETRELLEEVEKQFAAIRIRSFLRPHEGVSAARNFGTAQAVGDYIGYVDCDDQIPQYTVERVCELIDEFDSPDLLFGYVQFIREEEDKRLKEGDTAIYGNRKLLSELYRYHLSGASEELATELDDGAKLKIGPVARFAKMEIARRCSFPVTVRVGEDILWSLDLLRKAHSAVISDGIWYWYWRDHLSATLKYRDDAYENALCFFSALPDYLEEKMGMREQDVTLRVLGEINRVVRANFIYAESELNNREKSSIVADLMSQKPVREYMTLPKIIKAGPMALAKYILLKTGLAEIYWKREARSS